MIQLGSDFKGMLRTVRTLPQGGGEGGPGLGVTKQKQEKRWRQQDHGQIVEGAIRRSRAALGTSGKEGPGQKSQNERSLEARRLLSVHLQVPGMLFAP